jgi:hypothetical protein
VKKTGTKLFNRVSNIPLIVRKDENSSPESPQHTLGPYCVRNSSGIDLINSESDPRPDPTLSTKPEERGDNRLCNLPW